MGCGSHVAEGAVVMSPTVSSQKPRIGTGGMGPQKETREGE